MPAYGVQPTGFVRKGLPEIKAEIETRAREIFGPGLIHSPQSPMGQLIGLMSDIIAQEWEMAEETYQAYDPDQAEGLRLEQLARIRLLERTAGETDAQLARAITNEDVARIGRADFFRAIRAISGVRWARIYSNDLNVTDSNGLPPHSVSVAALGGSDAEIAQVARRFIVPGVTAAGNISVETTVEGFCRAIGITRPTEIPITLEIDVRKLNDSNGCPPPSNAAIAEAVVAGLSGDSRPANGVTLTTHIVSRTLAAVHPNVEVIAVRASRTPAAVAPLPLPISFYEIADIALLRTLVITVA